MEIQIRMRSLTDWSDPQKGTALVELLATHGLPIAKAGEFEPLRKPYQAEEWARMWRGSGLEWQDLESSIIFRGGGGGRPSYVGMSTWYQRLPEDTELFNTVWVLLKIKRSLSAESLIALGDDLFRWADGAYGYIAHVPNRRQIPPERRKFLKAVYWVNYFGKIYTNCPDFTPDLPKTPVGDGIRVMVAESHTDPKRQDLHGSLQATDRPAVVSRCAARERAHPAVRFQRALAQRASRLARTPEALTATAEAYAEVSTATAYK